MSSFSEKQREFKEKAAQEAIYEATIRLISEKGGDALTMQAIAASVGIATGTLYNYFKNKVDLMTFVHDKLHDLIMEQIEDIAHSEIAPQEKLDNIICEIFNFCQEYHVVFDLADKLGVKECHSQEEKQQDIKRLYSCIQGVMDEGVQQGVFQAVDTRIAAEVFFAVVIGTMEIQRWHDDYQLQTEADKIRHFFMTYLKGE